MEILRCPAFFRGCRFSPRPPFRPLWCCWPVSASLPTRNPEATPAGRATLAKGYNDAIAAIRVDIETWAKAYDLPDRDGRLSGGNETIVVAGTDRRDEIGALARALLGFQEAARHQTQLESQAATMHAATAARATRLEAMVHAFEAQIGEQVGGLACASTKLEGTAHSMTTIAAGTNQRATIVADASGHASASAQTVAAASEQLTASIAEISRQVVRSTEMTHRAVYDARRSNDIVQTLASGAQRIGDVVGLITGIASQTNLQASIV
jgi:methyl-accepting chemotaxis protein